MDIGKRIKELRELKDIRSGDFANMIDVTPVFLSYLENGKKKPSIDTIEKICSALDIPITDFFSEGEEPIALTPELKDLLNNARQLPPDKIAILNNFIEQFALGHKPKYVKTTVDGKGLEYTYNEDERFAPTPGEEKEANELANKIIEMARKDPEARKRFEAEGFAFNFDEDK
jgi:HTH-type transcriptional repressor of puuD